jgi:hypothetical protein
MRVFASLNASGMRLDPWELVMSTFYSHCDSDIHRSRVKQLFEVTLSAAYDVKHSSSKDSYLRSYWIGFHRFTQMEDLFDEYNDHLDAMCKKDPASIMPLLSLMSNSLEIYRACDEPNRFKGNNGSTDFGFLYPLKLVGDKMSRSILLAAHHILTESGPAARLDGLKRLVFAFEKLRMRLHFCKMPAAKFERPFSKLAIGISKGEYGTDPIELEKNVYKFLGSLDGLPTKDALRMGVKQYEFDDKRVCQFILSKIQHSMQYGAQGRLLMYQFIPEMNSAGFQFAKGIKLESKDWSTTVQQRHGFKSSDQFDQLINSIGNAYLVNPGGQNIAMSLTINQGPPISQLTASDLLIRREALVDEAVDIWHFSTLG